MEKKITDIKVSVNASKIFLAIEKITWNQLLPFFQDNAMCFQDLIVEHVLPEKIYINATKKRKKKEKKLK